MRIFGLLLCLPLLGQQQAVQPRLIIHWLVREDFFAGLIDNDKIRLEKGLATLNSIEKYNTPVKVLAWRGLAETTKAVWALEAGDREAFARGHALGMTYGDECRRAAKGELAV